MVGIPRRKIWFASSFQEEAFELFSRASILGGALAHHNLGGIDEQVEYVEHDTMKSLHHMEQTAILGNKVVNKVQSHSR